MEAWLHVEGCSMSSPNCGQGKRRSTCRLHGPPHRPLHLRISLLIWTSTPPPLALAPAVSLTHSRPSMASSHTHFGHAHVQNQQALRLVLEQLCQGLRLKLGHRQRG